MRCETEKHWPLWLASFFSTSCLALILSFKPVNNPLTITLSCLYINIRKATPCVKKNFASPDCCYFFTIIETQLNDSISAEWIKHEVKFSSYSHICIEVKLHTYTLHTSLLASFLCLFFLLTAPSLTVFSSKNPILCENSGADLHFLALFGVSDSVCVAPSVGSL